MSIYSGKCDLYDHVLFERMYTVFKERSIDATERELLFQLMSEDPIAKDVEDRLRKEMGDRLKESDIIIPDKVVNKFIHSIAGSGSSFNIDTYHRLRDNFVGYSFSDEIECFELFKKNTNGVLHQHKLLKLSEYNIDAEIAKVNNPEILSKIEHKTTVSDKRSKSGTREKIEYSYIYWRKEYSSLKELNAKHYYTTVDIKFETIFDLIPYYPYVISFSSSNGSEYIVLSERSYVDDMLDEHLEYGHDCGYVDMCRQALQKHYFEMALAMMDCNKNCMHYDHMPVVCGVCDKSYCKFCTKYCGGGAYDC